MNTTRQAASVDQLDHDRVIAVDRYLSLWRQAMEDTGNTYESLHAHTGISGSHWQRLFTAEKPLRVENVLALPKDMQTRFEELRAKDLGLLVVRPMHGDDAIAAVLGGFASILAARPQAAALLNR
jgi:hypothetical protein